MGARRIGVFSAPPIGCVPFQRTLLGGIERKCAEKYNDASKLFNIKLSKELTSLNRNLPNSKMVYLDVYNPLLDIIVNYQNNGNPKFLITSLHVKFSEKLRIYPTKKRKFKYMSWFYNCRI